jgi:hypothetical protein
LRDMNMNEPLEEDAKRVLLVLYRLSKGTPGVRVHRHAIFAECERLKIFEMSDEEFDRFHRQTVREYERCAN